MSWSRLILQSERHAGERASGSAFGGSLMKSAVSLPAGDVALPAPRRTAIATGLAAIGIVYGDLGTSPLYTYQTIVGYVGGHAPADVAMGLLSLVIWALLLTISVKYCLFVMRADNHGEGGILALMSMSGANWSEGRRILIVMGLFGAALIYGDGCAGLR